MGKLRMYCQHFKCFHLRLCISVSMHFLFAEVSLFQDLVAHCAEKVSDVQTAVSL
jgi:hypothetical protein